MRGASMEFDIFFSISQTPVDGHTPSEAQMFTNFFDQVRAADALGYGVAWVAEAHLSTQTQKRTAQPVVPHWQGEVGLNVDLVQLAHRVFAQTQRIEIGSAVMNILCNGGPVAVAERVAAFCALHGLEGSEHRRLHLGFAAGRFEFNNRPYGIVPRDAVERLAWPVLKGQIFHEAAEILLRLLRREEISSEQIRPTVLRREQFRTDAEWQAVQQAAMARDGGTTPPQAIPIPRRFSFEVLKVVPQEWRSPLLVPVIGSHDPQLQEEVNALMPVQVFNLSITKPETIEETHQRMTRAYHRDGGPWRRAYMPRTVMVFLNDERGLSASARTAAAEQEAKAALGAYWSALEGTIDPARIAAASENAVIGDTDTIASQLQERFHRDDRLMLWFDFFNHDSARVIRNMAAFMDKVAPQLGAQGAA